ncbi:hypothetical protein [Ulvibacterium sp.]|uniref:hypothetical protein n=1 Tax=Ulvibacterium sp. TaxID=2665914 RepID=UPI003BADAB06
MRDIIPICCAFFLAILILFFYPNNEVKLQPGDISFTSINAYNDGFEVISLVNIPSNTTIHFTDSEWNGNRFGADESDMVWNTGGQVIKAGSTVSFTNLGSNPRVSIGTLKNKLRISKKKEAIFAYLGSTRMPTVFLAAVGNDEFAYGTLINTSLQMDKSALTFPKGTTYASYQGPYIYENRDEFYKELRKLSNYEFHKLKRTKDRNGIYELAPRSQ